MDHLPDNSSTGPLLVAMERLAKDNAVIVTGIDFKEQPKQMQDSLIRAPVQQGSGQKVAVVSSSAQELKFSLSVTGIPKLSKTLVLRGFSKKPRTS